MLNLNYIISGVSLIVLLLFLYFKIKKDKIENFEENFEDVLLKPKIKHNKTEDSRIPTTHWYKIYSANRDIVKFPNANKFEYHFDSKLWNVQSLELINASFPTSQYTSDIHNNKMDILINGSTIKTMTMTIGYFDISGYVNELNLLFAEEDIYLKFGYNPYTSEVHIQNISGTLDDNSVLRPLTNYSILYNTGVNSEYSNFNELGFLREDITINQNSSNVISPGRVYLFGAISVDIDIQEIDYSSGNNVIHNIKLKKDAISIYDNPHISSKRHLKPLRSLHKLTIEINFTAPYKKKRPYMFNGLDYELTFEIINIEHAPPFIAKLH